VPWTLSGYCYLSRRILVWVASALDGTRRATGRRAKGRSVFWAFCRLSEFGRECPDLYAFVLWYRFIVAQGLRRGVLHGMWWWVGTRSRVLLDSFCVE